MKQSTEVQLDLFEEVYYKPIADLPEFKKSLKEDLSRIKSSLKVSTPDVVKAFEVRMEAMESFMKDTGVYTAWMEESDNYIKEVVGE